MKINLKYLSETWRKFSQFSKHQISTSILKIQEIEQATIMPHQPNIKIGIPQKVRGVRIRKYGQQSANYIDKEVILLGAADPFFGHFLADGLSRTWPILDKKFINYTFVVVQGRGGGELKNFAKQLYKLVGIKKLLFITKPTRFKKILIPDLSFNYTRGIAHKKYTDTFAKIASTVPTDKSLPNKIYLSRTKLGYNETFGEKTIENIFAKNGFTIIYPEQLSLEKQIQLMKTAQTIAGVSGTALHLSLFAQNGIKLICIHKRNYILKMQILIDKLKNINGTYIDAFLTIGNLKKCDGKSSAALIGINKNLQNFFNDNNFIYSLDKNNNTKEYKQFIQSFNKQRRIIPKWLGGIILSFVPSHNLRHSLRKKWRLK